jgi:hypothetical protein
VGWVHADQNPWLLAAMAMFPMTRNASPEHRLLAHTRLAANRLLVAIGKILVIGHQQ